MTRIARLGRSSWFPVLALTLASWVAPPPDAAAQQQSSRDQPFFGVTTDGELIPDLFPIRATGVSTAPIVEAARAYLRMLTPEQTAETSFGLDSDEWRHWSNVPVGGLPRLGLSFRDMSDSQREGGLRPGPGGAQRSRIRAGAQHHANRRLSGEGSRRLQ